MASADTVSAFKNLARIGSERDVCVCPAHRNLQLVQDTLHRGAMLDQWAPVASFDTENDVCPLCMDAIGSTTTVRVSLCVCIFSQRKIHASMQIRQVRCPGNHNFCGECIESWLVYKQQNNCPICRHDCTHQS